MKKKMKRYSLLCIYFLQWNQPLKTGWKNYIYFTLAAISILQINNDTIQRAMENRIEKKHTRARFFFLSSSLRCVLRTWTWKYIGTYAALPTQNNTRWIAQDQAQAQSQCSAHECDIVQYLKNVLRIFQSNNNSI